MANDLELAVLLKLVADQFNRELERSGGLVGRFRSIVADWRTQLAAAGGTLLAIAKSTADYGDHAFKTAQKIGVLTEELTAVEYAAKLSDVGSGELAQALGLLARNAIEAVQGSQEVGKAFADLDIRVTDANGKVRSTMDLLLDLADRFRAMPDGPIKTAMAMQLIGRAGREMIPFLNQGRDGIKDTMEEARRLGLVMSAETAKASEEFNDNLTRLTSAVTGLKLKVGAELIPTISELVVSMTELASGPGGKAVGLMLQGLAASAILLNHALKETMLEIEAVRLKMAHPAGKDLFNQALRESLAQLDAGTERKLHDLFFGRQQASQQATGGAGAAEPDLTVKRMAEANAHIEEFRKRERENLALLLEGYRAIQAELEELQRGTGDALVEEFRVRQQLQHRELEGEVKLAQARLDAAQAGLAGYEELATRRIDLLQAQMKAELDNAELTEKEKLAITTRYQALIAREQRRATGGFVEGVREGFHTFVTDTETMFNLGVEVARQSFQAMGQAGQQFFFNLFEDRIQSLKDVLNNFLQFVKQIGSQVLGQLSAVAIFGGLGHLNFNWGLGAAEGGRIIRRFAVGGPVISNGDSVPALLTPGEYVLSNTGVDLLDQLNQGQWPFGAGGWAPQINVSPQMEVNVTNFGADVRTETRPGPDGRQILDIMVQDSLFRLIDKGKVDRRMNRAYGIRRQGVPR